MLSARKIATYLIHIHVFKIKYVIAYGSWFAKGMGEDIEIVPVVPIIMKYISIIIKGLIDAFELELEAGIIFYVGCVLRV